jgi:deoxycytidylate deaminase
MSIKYPYIPSGKSISYVSADSPFMAEAKGLALKYRGQLVQPNGVVLVKNGEIIGRGSIGMNYHYEKGCERIKHNMPTGVGYDLCPGCSDQNHGEANAIKDAAAQGHNPKGAELYLWGHWWCCEPCWDKMIAAGIANVYLLEHSEVLFNKSDPGNILGRQFDY